LRFFSALLSIVLVFSFVSTTVIADEKEEKSVMSSGTFSGLKLRGVGPAFMSGRIADIVIHPDDNNLWYVAVGSGGVWKTENAGVTWKPIFDGEASYSIGCVTVDPGNPHVVWVGTGENVGGRHVGYGDGVYRSGDGGGSWENLGLKDSQHISRIVVHPGNSSVVWVAAQGPLWSEGGERGLYKTTDGGKNWKKVLGDDEWTGVTDVAIDPRHPDRLYAATWQRHRNVAAYMGGGPGTGIHRSVDGGETWEQLKKGLPKSDMGKIGLAISPQRPDVLYAAIELDRRTGAVYRSSDRGGSWNKMSETVSGGTGPHYYQELYASPHRFDRLYLCDVVMQISEDGGKTFRRMKNKFKHVDNHALAFRQDDPDYLLVGCDGGVYESFDLAKNWRFMANLPVTQFYKVALDDAEPFYNIYGGTQDNNTQGGPSRTDNYHGIRNADWFITLFGDGHQPATEPGNPDIIYSEMQQGYMARIDRTTGEIVIIQPQPEEGEPYERFNWDAPILVSPHSPTRLYFASQRVWRSEDRGDSWTAISGDLTRNQDRITLPIMGGTWSWDAAWDFFAMSNYNTITSIAESPLVEGLIYAGTDDGLIQITEDGGENWRSLEVGKLPGVPATAFVNDIKADLHDANTVYVALDNHKYGDLNPYLLRSTNRGGSWKSIAGNIPERTLVWRLVQDHVRPDLLFAGTEFGVYFTIDGGQRWIKLTGGVPTISFRDLAIQRRENDLVGATFGRGFYILDDYSVLREVSEEQLGREATLFSVRKTWWYMQRPVLGFSEKGSQGAALFTAKNPPYGAVFTYYLSEDLESIKSARKKKEKALTKEDKDIPFPGWDKLEAERRQPDPVIVLTVRDSDGNVVRRVDGPAKKGFHRVAWDLRYPSTRAVRASADPPSGESRGGVMAGPGRYTVQLSKRVDGAVTAVSEEVPFEVVRMRDGALPGASDVEFARFWQEVAELSGAITALTAVVDNTTRRVNAMKDALAHAPAPPGDLDRQLYELSQKLFEFDGQLNGHRTRRSVGEKIDPTIHSRLRYASGSSRNSTYGPTQTARRSLEIAAGQFEELKTALKEIVDRQIPAMEKALADAGAPWVEGQPIPDIGE
jgi:photosystem II stability/assembly factor-like uncharacterized protein